MTKGYVTGSACDTCGRPLGTRNKLGRCTGCRTAAFKRAITYTWTPDPATLERIEYYAARAERGLDLFAGSPYRRLPGAHARALERQTKTALTTGTITPAREVKQASE